MHRRDQQRNLWRERRLLPRLRPEHCGSSLPRERRLRVRARERLRDKRQRAGVLGDQRLRLQRVERLPGRQELQWGRRVSQHGVRRGSPLQRELLQERPVRRQQRVRRPSRVRCRPVSCAVRRFNLLSIRLLLQRLCLR